MSESGRDGFVASESAFIVLSIAAIILLAAVFPTFNLFSIFNPPATDSAGGGGGSLGEGMGNVPGKVGGGAPGQSDLSEPPEKSKIAGRTNKSSGRQPLFIARGAGSQYWRQTAYMTYTGTAWGQATANRPLEAGVPNDGLTRDGREVEYEVELLTDTTSLPTVWQPETVEVVNHSNNVRLEVSSVGGVHSSRTVEKGSIYTGISQKPPADPSILRESEGPYPDEIETTYTQLPVATPERVQQFGDELTADADSPYEASVTIRNWLRSNKEYDLNTSIEPSEPIADQFLFEVDRGYCQHFATTMAVLLRTQDIPARYVVGFAGGRPVGQGEYLVTSNHAHAWVEVYFADVGWVTFEPTAASDRDISEKPPQPPYNISLNRSVVAGAPVTIHVSKNGSAIVGAPVYLEGERIDWTDSKGEATTRLPWAQNITIVARPPGSETRRRQSAGEVTAIAPAGNLPPPKTNLELRYAVREPSLEKMSLDSQESNTRNIEGVNSSQTNTADQDSSVFQTAVTLNQTAENYTAETNVTIDLPESVIRGETARLKASVKDVPLRNATIAINGETVGHADRAGVLELTFNNTSLGENTVSASRGEVNGSATIFVKKPPDPDDENGNDDPDKPGPRTINLTVSPLLDFPVPFGPATVNVTDDAGPVKGALISVNGNEIGESSVNGTVQMRLPVSKSVTVSAIGPKGATADQTIENLYRNAAILLGGVTIVALAIILILRRLEKPLQRIQRRFLWVIGLILDGFLRFTEMVSAVGHWLQTGLRRLWREVRGISLGKIIANIQAISFANIARVKAWLVAIVSGVLRRLRERFQDQSDSIRRRQATSEESHGTGFGFAELWQEFLAIVQPPRVSTRTPGEIGRYAVNRGFPEKPVSLFIQWYRDAIYGPDTDTATRIERAKNYLSAIREGDDQQ